MSKPASVEDVAKQIQEAVGMTEKEFKEYFRVELDPARPGVAVVRWRWLREYASFKALLSCIEGMGGKRTDTYKAEVPLAAKEVPTSMPLPGGEAIPVVKAEPTPPPQEKVISVTSDNIMVANIPIANLELGAFSPRMQFDPQYIAKLAEDIEAEGQLKPILVRPHPTDPQKYQVIDGEHRIRALQKLGKSLVRAEVHPLPDEEAYYRAMRINQLHGKALEELEEACHINKMMALFSYAEEQIAKRFNRSQQWVSQRRALALKIAPKVEEAVTTRVVKPRHAIEISLLPKEDQEKVVEKIAEIRKVGRKFSTRATRGLVHAIRKASTAEHKQQILEKPLEAYAHEFKDPQQLETALLTIKPEDDFLAKSREIKTEEQVDKLFGEALAKGREPITTEQCPGCGKQLRIDWVKGEVSWS